MEDFHIYFKGKKVTLMGLGLLGRGIGDAKFLAECGAELIVTDLKTKEALAASVAELQGFKNITFVLGEHRLEDFRGRDFILKAAGVPLDSLYIAEAQKHHVPVEMSTSLFAKCALPLGATLVGITGTRGKSTVTHLLHDVLQNALTGEGNNDGKKVFLGGNVRGLSTLPLLSEIKKGDIVVMELDSWQLQGFGEAKISPHVAVFTTFLSDHQNYYKGDMNAYLDDKANIFRNQTKNDVFILGRQVAEIVQSKYAKEIKAETAVVGAEDFPKDWKLSIPGEHNKYNAALAIAAARKLGINDSDIKKTVEAFTGVPGRLQKIRNWNEIDIYNDTTATTPDATKAALAALNAGITSEPHTILIMGGADKSLDVSSLIPIIGKMCKKVIVLPGTGTEKISALLNELNQTKGGDFIENVQTLSDAVTKATAAATESDTILLSPAFASFGLFTNEFDRGEQFDAIIKKLP